MMKKSVDELYVEAVRAIESRGIMPDRAPSLEPMHRALARMPAGLDPDRVIVVAGTNGKGSVCATLEALLVSAGERVGLYTSPHLVETTERFRVSGQDVSREVFRQAYDRVVELTDGIPLSHFEILTLMAHWIFASGEVLTPVDRLILEVGLGGTWDATNAIPHHWCVITSLGLDHQNLLGNSLVEIARNKFGIIGPGSRVIYSPLPSETQALAEEIQAATGSVWREAADWKSEVVQTGQGPEFRIATEWGDASLILPGARGAQNTATALTAFSELGYDPGAYLGALQAVRWPGRMSRMDVPGVPCPIYFSGDHNPQGLQSLLEILPYYRRNRIHFVVGVGKDKDADGVLAPLFALRDADVHLTETPFRGRALSEYGEWLSCARSANSDPIAAFRAATAEAQRGDLVIVTGSLYLVGGIMGALRAGQ